MISTDGQIISAAIKLKLWQEFRTPFTTPTNHGGGVEWKHHVPYVRAPKRYSGGARTLASTVKSQTHTTHDSKRFFIAESAGLKWSSLVVGSGSPGTSVYLKLHCPVEGKRYNDKSNNGYMHGRAHACMHARTGYTQVKEIYSRQRELIVLYSVCWHGCKNAHRESRACRIVYLAFWAPYHSVTRYRADGLVCQISQSR